MVSDAGSITDAEINAVSAAIMPPGECNHSTKPTKGKKCGKCGKNKKAHAKIKSNALSTMPDDPALSSGCIEPEDDDFEVKVEKAPAKKGNNRKRKSDAMNEDDANGASQTISVSGTDPPPAKRRTTRASSSIMPATNPVHEFLKDDREYNMHIDVAEDMTLASVSTMKKGSQKGARKGRKGTSTAMRKASATTTVSITSSRKMMPSDEVLDAALEADLDRPLTDNEIEDDGPEIQYPKLRRLTRTRPGSRDGAASLAPAQKVTRLASPALQALDLGEQDPSLQLTPATVVKVDQASQHEANHSIVAAQSVGELAVKSVGQNGSSTQESGLASSPSNVLVAKPIDTSTQPRPIPKKSKKPMKNRLPSRQLSKRNAQPSIPSPAAGLSPNHNLATSGHVSQVVEDESANETDGSVVKRGPAKRGRKKGKQGTGTATISRRSAEVVQHEVENAVDQLQPVPTVATMDLVENARPVDPNHNNRILSSSQEEAVALIEPSRSTLRSEQDLEACESTRSVQGQETLVSNKSPVPIQSVHHSPATPQISEFDRESIPLQASLVPETQAQVATEQTTPRSAASPQSSDVENQPPSSRPSSVRPPLRIYSPTKTQTTRIPLAATPCTSPSKRKASRLQSTMPWSAIDYDKIFLGSPANKENNPFTLHSATSGEMSGLASPEKRLNLEEWIQFNAQRGVEQLRSECERIIGRFEGEGVRALKTLEGISCID